MWTSGRSLECLLDTIRRLSTSEDTILPTEKRVIFSGERASPRSHRCIAKNSAVGCFPLYFISEPARSLSEWAWGSARSLSEWAWGHRREPWDWNPIWKVQASSWIPRPSPGQELPAGHQQMWRVQEQRGETLFLRVNTEEGLAAAPHKGKKESNLCMRKQKSKSF